MILSDYFTLSKATLSNETKTLTNPSKNTFIRRAKKLGNAQRWGLDFTSPPLPYQQAMGVNAQLNSLGGRFGTLYIKNPFKFNGITQAVSVNGVVSAGQHRLLLTLPLAADAFLAGDLVQFGHDKVYQVTSWESSTQALEIYPSLAADVLNGEMVKLGDNVLFYCAHDGDNVEITVTNFCKPIPLSAKFVEVI